MACSIGARARAALHATGLGFAILLLVGGFASPTPPRSATSPLDAEIARQVTRAVQGKLGMVGLVPLLRESGELLVGESRSFEIELRRGEQFLAVGACDKACGDLDLTLTAPEKMPPHVDHEPNAFPVVGAIVTRSGRYTVRVEMVSCAQRCRFSLAFLVTRLGDPGERDRLGEAVALQAEMVASILAHLANDGHELSRIDGFEQPVLAGGRQETFSVEIPRAGRALVTATCDFGCADLDLFLEDASGASLARDELPDPEPLLWVDLPAAGIYRVTVRMEHCIEEPCAYAVSVLAELPDASALGGSGGQGSCFAVHPNGLVATAAHVVAGAAVLRVHLADGTNVGAELHAIDPESDLAVLRIPRATPDHLPLAPADVARLGLRVFTLGFPALEILGDDPKFSEGVVSGLGGSASGLLQITVPIQPGSSGAPLITEEGHAVGVVVGAQNADFFQANTGYLPQSVNYAVRSELLARMLPAGLDLPPPVDRAHAIARARAAACWIEALGASTVRHSPRAARFLPRP